MDLRRTISTVLRKEGNTFRTSLLMCPLFLQNAKESDYNYDSDSETQLQKGSTKNELESLILFSSPGCTQLEVTLPDVRYHWVSQNF